jgi:hypothetical protein
MNPEIKARWLEALRSRRYKQTSGCLRDSEGFCCLGVLCDVVAPDLGLKWEKGKSARLDFSIAGSHVTLPLEVVEAAGVSGIGVLPFGGNLSHLNDNGHTFAMIADVIEKEL